MNNHDIAVFLGHEIEDGNEIHVLQRLCRDLAARRIAARVFANFHTTRRMQRQIDFLVLTDGRLTLVELKCLDQAGRLVGGVNGRWKQMFDDGVIRELDVNPYAQAVSATYSVSDEMRYLADRGEVPAAARKFFKQIDTVVCIYPRIPHGSQLARADHMTVVGYEQLLARLVQAGGPIAPQWAVADWDTFARHLGVFRRDDGGEDQQQVRDRQVLEDYRRSSIRSHTADLSELVTPSATIDDDRVDAAPKEPGLTDRHTMAVSVIATPRPANPNSTTSRDATGLWPAAHSLVMSVASPGLRRACLDRGAVDSRAVLAPCDRSSSDSRREDPGTQVHTAGFACCAPRCACRPNRDCARASGCRAK